MASVLLQAPLKYGGTGPIANLSKVVQNSKIPHRQEVAVPQLVFCSFDPCGTLPFGSPKKGSRTTPEAGLLGDGIVTVCNAPQTDSDHIPRAAYVAERYYFDQIGSSHQTGEFQ
jgi:hypothetical protein